MLEGHSESFPSESFIAVKILVLKGHLCHCEKID
jgi:hypothetical protein